MSLDLCTPLLDQSSVTGTCNMQFDQYTEWYKKYGQGLKKYPNEMMIYKCYSCVKMLLCVAYDEYELKRSSLICYSISGLSLLLVGLYMIKSKRLSKQHPYPMIAVTCLTGALYYL